MKLAYVVTSQFMNDFGDFEMEGKSLGSDALTYFSDELSKHESEHGYIDRHLCENDEFYQQIIPYVTVCDDLTGKIFCYTRGEAGDENRLHGKCSIGLGGHIDQEYPGLSFAEMLVEEAKRELIEEIGYDFSYMDMINLNKSFTNHSFFIQTDTDEVSRVHTGISTIFPINQGRINKHEEGVITKGEWIDPDELYKRSQPGAENYIELEEWSVIALKYFFIQKDTAE